MRKSLIFVSLFTGIFAVFLIGRNISGDSLTSYKLTSKTQSKVLEIKLEKNQKGTLAEEFNLTSKDGLLNSFGTTASEAIKKQPIILDVLKKMDSSVKEDSFIRGSENMVAVLRGGKKIILLNGCKPNKDTICDGTERVIAIEKEGGKIYMLSENGHGRYAGDPKVYIYGEPSEKMAKLLLYAYFY